MNLRCIALGLLLLSANLLHSAETNRIPAETIAEAEKIFGLEFTDKEREQMGPALWGRRQGFELIRKEPFPNDLSLALVFRPWPAGFEIRKETRQFRWKPARKIERPASDDDLAFLNVTELAALIRARKISSEELTRFCIARLKKHGPALNCVVTLTEGRALQEARRADAELARGKWRGPLHGIPYGAKDLLDSKDIPTSWGVSILTNRVPNTDATVIRKLSDAGAVLVAKLSLGELAMGDVWFGGKTRNPFKPENGSSGSSAGSASAVAAGLVPFAIGSETLGSIVSPCAVCGVTGLRPTFGRVSRAGAMTLCWSLDKIGPIARSAQDCALVFDAIRGADPADPSTVNAPFNPNPRDYKKLRVAYLKADFDRSDSNKTNDLATLQFLREKIGIELRVVELPKAQKSAFNLILAAEASAAFDELTRSNLDDKLVQQASGSWPNFFRAARFIPAVEYIQANRLRTRLIEDMDKLFAEIDVLVAPTWSGNQLLFSNTTGHPTVVVPNGNKAEGAPASICFIGKLLGEADALSLADAYQKATSFHRQRPTFRN